MRRQAKVDANQPDLVRQLRSLPGCTVFPTHQLGCGFGDAVIGFKGRNYIIEIKDPAQPPSKRQLTAAEQEFHRLWRGQVAVVESLGDCLELIGAIKCPLRAAS